MDECTHVFDQMDELRRGSLDDAEQQRLYTHLAECGECRGLFEFHRELGSAGAGFDAPGDDAFDELRARVIGEIRGTPGRRFLADKPAVPFRSGHLRLMAAAAAVFALVLGFAAGRIPLSRGSVSEGDLLVAALERTAEDHTRLRDVENSESVVSNVRVRPAGRDRVVMAFDLSRHVEIERDGDDPLVNEVLVHAMLDQSSMGSRLKAVSMADSLGNEKVEEALIFAMVSDPALPVRLRALEVLAKTPAGEAVEEGLLRVLHEDDSMQMRLLAVDLLARAPGAENGVMKEILEERTKLDPAVANRLAGITKL